MARPATGQVIAPDGKRQPSWAIRFRAYGKRRFRDSGAKRGRLESPARRARAPPHPRRRGARHLAAREPRARSAWSRRSSRPSRSSRPPGCATVNRAGGRGRSATTAGLWSCHLLPHFGGHRLSEITAEEVDRYRADKLREGRLAPNAVNKTLTRLAQILELAVEYGHIERNPAKGRRRRAKGTEPRRSWVEPEQLGALLDAADPYMRPIIATLAGAGLRIGEAVALDWRDVALGAGTLTRAGVKDCGRRGPRGRPGGRGAGGAGGLASAESAHPAGRSAIREPGSQREMPAADAAQRAGEAQDGGESRKRPAGRGRYRADRQRSHRTLCGVHTRA